jgi:hypothetical protein
MMNKNKQLLCRKGHHLGEINWNGDDVPQIMVYREAVKDGDELPVEMLGPFLGQAELPCSICKSVRVWGVSITVAIYLIEAMPANMLFDFWQELLKKAKMPEKVDDGTNSV